MTTGVGCLSWYNTACPLRCFSMLPLKHLVTDLGGDRKMTDSLRRSGQHCSWRKEEKGMVLAWLGLLIAHRWYFQDQTSQSLGNILTCSFGFKHILRTKGHDRVPVGGVVFLKKADFSLSLTLAKG